MANNTPKQLTADVANIEEEISWPAKKTNDILVPIDGCGSNTLAPDHKYQGHIVDPRVLCIEEVVAELCTENQGNQEGYYHAYRRDVNPIPIPRELTIHDHSDECVLQSEGRAKAKDHDGEEEKERPELRTGHFGDTSGVRQERNGKAANRVISRLRKLLEESDDAENSKASHNLVERVTGNDNEHILDNILVLVVVRGVGREVSHAEADREEDLAAGHLPDVTVT